MVREGRVLVPKTGSPLQTQFASDYRIVVLPVGAMVSSASSSTTIAVQPGHGFSAGQKLIVDTDTDRYRTVASVTSVTVVTTEAVSVAAGEFLVNLGTDTGTTDPNYDGSGLAIYSDSGYVNALSDETTSTDAVGRYRYWHKGIDRWELVLDTTGDPYTFYTETDDGNAQTHGVLHLSTQASGGDGDSASPWTGWETAALAAVAANSPIHFDAGYYSAPTFAVPVTNTNTPSGCVITGDGSACTFLTITSGAGQFRVYGSGSGTRVLDGVRVVGLTVYAGATNTSAGLVSFENFDIGCFVDDIRVDPTASYNVSVGIQVLNCENCHFGFLEVRGRVVTVSAAGHVETGLRIYTDDGIQRGDIHFSEVHVTDITTGLSISSSGGSVNNIYFSVFKAVNPSVVNGTMGVLLAGNAEQITFGNLMMESLANGLDLTSVENLVVVNGLASNIHNEANSAGAAFTISNGDGGHIFSRIDTVYNGFVLDGTTTRYFVQQVAAGTVTGTYYSDTSSGSNFYIVGNVVTSAMTAAGRFTSTGGFSLGARAAAGSIAGGILALPASPTTNNFTMDTEAAAASDDLDTLSGGFDGAIVILSAADDARTVVVKHGTGNIFLVGQADKTLDDSRDILILQKIGSTNWFQLAFNDMAGGTYGSYAASNVTTDRTYDANATTTDELADVLGTLIADLRSRGLVG